jgi:hypothetical protein
MYRYIVYNIIYIQGVEINMFAFGWASFANLMAALKGKLGKVPPPLPIALEPIARARDRPRSVRPPTPLSRPRRSPAPVLAAPRRAPSPASSARAGAPQDITHTLKSDKTKNMDSVRGPAAARRRREREWPPARERGPARVA